MNLEHVVIVFQIIAFLFAISVLVLGSAWKTVTRICERAGFMKPSAT